MPFITKEIPKMSPSKPVNADGGREAPAGSSMARRGMHAIARFLLAVVILGAAVAVSFYWLTNRPRARRRPPQSGAALVEVKRLESDSHHIAVDAMGTVQAARTVVLTPRVSGEITDVSREFLPGGRFRAGEQIAKIDPADYELAVQQRQTEIERRAAEIERQKSIVYQCDCDIIKAESELRTEEGQQSVAEREYELLGETITEEDKDLVLRQPQLRTAQAALEATKAAKKAAEASYEAARAAKADAELALEQARLDLDRTNIRAPFNAMVNTRSVNLGVQVSPGTQLAELVGTDEYWVQLSVPVDQLKWVTIPNTDGEKGSHVRIYYEAHWGKGVHRSGTVTRLMAGVEPEGRMARLLVSVDDPLGLETREANVPPMILGAYVRVEIEGKEVKDAVSISRSALRDGNKIWVMSPENTLDIREVEIIWSGDESVLVAGGLRAGELLITSDLGTPVQGMLLRATPTEASARSSGPAGSASRTGDREERL
jgi:RND family efflux transporter MFP subunit